MERDLASVDLWEESLRRSRQRRELAAARGPELPGRTLSVTALVALAGVPATGVAAAKLLGGGDEGGATATAAAAKPVAGIHTPATVGPLRFPRSPGQGPGDSAFTAAVVVSHKSPASCTLPCRIWFCTKPPVPIRGDNLKG